MHRGPLWRRMHTERTRRVCSSRGRQLMRAGAERAPDPNRMVNVSGCYARAASIHGMLGRPARRGALVETQKMLPSGNESLPLGSIECMSSPRRRLAASLHRHCRLGACARWRRCRERARRPSNAATGRVVVVPRSHFGPTSCPHATGADSGYYMRSSAARGCCC